MRYRKKPVVIDAFRLGEAWPDWFHDAVSANDVVTHLGTDATGATFGTVTIRTLEGDMTGVVGEWIIRGVKGELYPCKPDIFAATYEPA